MVSFHATGSSKRLAWRLRRTFHSISRKRHKYWGEREASGKPPENSLQTICRLMDGGLATDHADKEMGAVTEPAARKVVLEVDGVQWATQGNVMEAVVGLQPGVIGVEANPVAQTATVTYDPARTSVPELEPPRSFRRPGLVAQPVGVSSFLAA